MLVIKPQVEKRILKSLGPVVHPLYVLYLLFNDWKSWRYFPAWFWSFRPGYLSLHEARPWLPFEAADWLRSYLQRDMKVFEYGSGGSTIFLSERADQVFSVEHDKNWHTLVSQALARRGITNCSYGLREPRPILGTSSGEDHSGRSEFMFDEREWEYPDLTFDAYVKSIDAHPDHTFDLVLVDGRARAACIDHALPKVRRGGHLMLDNSNDDKIVGALGVLKPYARVDFHGIAPGWPPARWTTSVWQMRAR